MQPLLAPFTIIITVDGKRYRAKVEQTHVSSTIEVYTVSAGEKVVYMQSDRPLLRRSGMYRRKVKWTALNIQIGGEEIIDKLVAEIEARLHRIEYPPPSR